MITFLLPAFFFLKQLLKTEEHSWSLAELVHAVVLLTHYHSLASFTFGCGINPEIHCDGGHTFRLLSVDGYCICDITNGNHDEYKMHTPDTDITVSIMFWKVKRLPFLKAPACCGVYLQSCTTFFPSLRPSLLLFFNAENEYFKLSSKSL